MDPDLVDRLLGEIAQLRLALEAARAPSHVSDLDIDSAQWLAGILANSPDIISILDAEGTVLYINRTMPSVTAEEVIGRRADEFLPEPHRPAWNECLERALTTSEPQHVEIFSRGDYWWDTRLVPIRQGDAIAHVLSIGQDITARRQAQTALALKEQQLGLALEASGMGQWWWSLARDQITMDPAAKRILAWPAEREDFSYAALLERVHPDDRGRVEEQISNAVATGANTPLECRLLLPDGALRWILVTGKVLTDAGGRATDLIGGLLDTTRHKEADTQLHRARKLEAIGQLAGGVAHDFNNLLVAIMGNIELGKRASDAAQRDQLLDEALASCARASDLTRQLLAFSRRQPLVEVAFDVNDLLDDTLRLLRRLIPENIAVELLRARRPARVIGDRGQIEQVVVNLCVNARDAMPNGGRLVIETEMVLVNGRFLESHPWAEPGRYVLVSVSDTGIGIPPALIDRVFDPFFTTKEHGTGLGLATSYGIVKQHGGMLHIYSEIGKGTTVKLYLPVAERPAVEVGTKIEGTPAGGTETVLVAEDEELVRAVVVRVLEGAGYEVVPVGDGTEAVAVFRREPSRFGLVLLDAVMPNKSGAEAAAEIRAIRPEVAIVISSGYTDALAWQPVLAGEIAFLAKPYEPDTLLRLVRIEIDKHHGGSPPS